MANVNYSNSEGWMGAGLTWNYYFSPIDFRYNDVWVVPEFGNNNTMEILRKWAVTSYSPEETAFWIEVRNTGPSLYFAVNFVNISP